MTTSERMDCGHLKADWVETTHVWHQGPCVLGCTKAHCRTCAAIASAEARAWKTYRNALVNLLSVCSSEELSELVAQYAHKRLNETAPDSTKDPK